MKLTVFLLLAAFSFVCYFPALSNGFVQDDIPAIVENASMQSPANFVEIFSRNAWNSIPGFTHVPNYRPLSAFSHSLTIYFFGLDPAVFHLINMLLHAAIGFLVFLISLKLFGSGLAAFFSAVFFLVHPLNSEVVCGAVNREELLTALFYLAGFHLFLEFRDREKLPLPGLAVIALCFAASLFSKENGVTFPLAVLAADILSRAPVAALKKRIPLYAALFWMLAGYFLLRYFLFGTLTSHHIPYPQNPLLSADATLVERILTPFAVFFEMFRLFVSPLNLTVDYGLNAFPVVKSVSDARFMAGFLMIAASFAFAYALFKKKNPLLIPFVLIFVSFSIFSNTFFLGSIIFAERLLYLPCAFLAIFAGEAARRILQAAASPVIRRILSFVIIAVIALFSIFTFDRTKDWRDDYSLYSSSLASRPGSARLHSHLSKIMIERKDLSG
ncbi:MAG: DUF1736 domain-containing protein, partial [Deltaproteobacteria bacterium]|nr:DUF1736 domain-containing protein [Deltaproteobacteria bacterium]